MKMHQKMSERKLRSEPSYGDSEAVGQRSSGRRKQEEGDFVGIDETKASTDMQELVQRLKDKVKEKGNPEPAGTPSGACTPCVRPSPAVRA